MLVKVLTHGGKKQPRELRIQFPHLEELMFNRGGVTDQWGETVPGN